MAKNNMLYVFFLLHPVKCKALYEFKHSLMKTKCVLMILKDTSIYKKYLNHVCNKYGIGKYGCDGVSIENDVVFQIQSVSLASMLLLSCSLNSFFMFWVLWTTFVPTDEGLILFNDYIVFHSSYNKFSFLMNLKFYLNLLIYRSTTV